ncbi:hypothetical protein DSL72_005626 [Monilinia vaccinii-corymbosi]|uniref:Uncharacterized protein n=1 Tax=Monilinia vaccinii-corymbosi TaxID=61207 RepID=A0A8A3PGA3_9HELO|nr:hypothetical protein DSL72_005626 [Monilinia vaccinii-corymbosi]
MPYHARSDVLSAQVISGGLEDPRAAEQESFMTRMSCRDLNDFISNTTEFSPLDPGFNRASHESMQISEWQTKLDQILSRSKEIKLPLNKENGVDKPLSNFIPGPVTTGGLSRSPAFDCLPVVSHWAERTGEPSAPDPAATVRISSTWEATHVIGEGATMHCPLGAPCWSLKTHGTSPVDPGSNKFSQEYLSQTKTLVTTVALPLRIDTPQTGGVLSAATQISWMRNARVADTVDCSMGMLLDAAELLTARNKAIATGTPEILAFAEVREVTMPTWCSARKPLPPKLSGVAISTDSTTADIIASECCEGPLLNNSIFSLTLGHSRGIYGGSISALWALMDSAFLIDYSIGKDNPELSEKIATGFAEVAAIAEASTSAGPHITDTRIIKGCTYSCLRQKVILEDENQISSRPCVVVWNDLARLARFKVADGVFCHFYHDGGGGEYMAAIAGLGLAVHDWIDLGADVTSGEISNIIPSLTGGSLEEEPLAEMYSRLVGALIWYRNNDPYNPAALSLMVTNWWHFANCRHRPVSLLGRTDLDAVTSGIAATVPEGRPSLEHFRACGTKVERSERPLANAEARLQSLLSSDPLPETRAVIDLLISPILNYVKGADSLPFENEYLGAVLAAMIGRNHAQKIEELWDLALVLWESGAMWAVGVAGLCYTHNGKSNCDRARDDFSEATWG